MTNLRSTSIGKLFDWLQLPVVRKTMKLMQAFVVFGVMLYLLDRLQRLGWHQIWHALPRTPWFYIVFASSYIMAPLADTLIYSLVFKHNLIKYVAIFIRKMIYNDVVDYTGEAHLALWAKHQLDLEPRAVLSAVKDVNLLSGLAGNVLTLVLVSAFMLTGQMAILFSAGKEVRHYLIIAIFLGTFLTVVIVALRRHLLALSGRKTLQVLGIHIARSFMVAGLLSLQWAVALPAVPYGTWLVFLTGGTLLYRIPFLPNRNLMFMGLALGMTDLVNVPKTAISAVFLASGSLSLMASILMISMTYLIRPKKIILDIG